MTKKYSRKPEVIYDRSLIKSYRLKIFGGWIVTEDETVFENGILLAAMKVSVFVPDPEHRWDLDEEEIEEDIGGKEPMTFWVWLKSKLGRKT